MSLPKNLPPVIQTFGQGSYPAGANPWSGQPAGVLPVNPYFTPGAPPPAEYSAYMIGALGAFEQTLLNSKAAELAATWARIPTTANANMNNAGGQQAWAGCGLDARSVPQWCTIGGGTVMPTTGSNTLAVLVCSDGGNAFQDLAFPASTYHATRGGGAPINGIEGDDSGGVLFTTFDFTTVSALSIYYYYSGTWHNATTSPTGGSGYSARPYYDRTNQVFVAADIFGTTTIAKNSTTIAHTSFTGAPSGIGSVNSALPVKGIGGAAVILPVTQTGTVWAHNVYYTAPTVTAPAYGAYPMVSGDTTTSGDYDIVNGVFVAAIYNGSNTRFVISSNGTVWTTQGNIALQNCQVACLGGLWIAVSATNVVYWSLDMGLTWTKANAAIGSRPSPSNVVQMLLPNYNHSQLAVAGSFQKPNFGENSELAPMICGNFV